MNDARALWINPAGLGASGLASLLGEFAMDRAAGAAWRLSQYSFGLSSRGIGVAYQRDRFQTGGSAGAWSVGGGVNLGAGAIGAVYTFHRPKRGLDIGLSYAPLGSLNLGGVVRNIGHPMTADSTNIPVAVVAGAQWRPARGRLRLSAETIGTDRLAATGFDMAYRAGAQLTFPGSRPVAALAAFDFSSGGRVSRWSVGLVIGQNYHTELVGSSAPASGGNPRIDTVSLAAVAAQPLSR
ncbi:MAG: hypothetical protein HY560_09085 [Gemmatimonadetes bacterium]|nr:hypothetical protein [Gemmatimonadota bacterium]